MDTDFYLETIKNSKLLNYLEKREEQIINALNKVTNLEQYQHNFNNLKEVENLKFRELDRIYKLSMAINK
jgi:hypothetical protein